MSAAEERTRQETTEAQSPNWSHKMTTVGPGFSRDNSNLTTVGFSPRVQPEETS